MFAIIYSVSVSIRIDFVKGQTMSTGNFVLPTPQSVVISAENAEKLVSLGNGDAALLYIWILKNRGEFSHSAACAALKRSSAAISAAMSALAAVGLIAAAEPKKDEPIREIPEYTVQDIKHEMENGTVFSLLVDEVQAAMGKHLSPSDLIKLFGIYNDLHLPPEVILQLVCHCIEECRKKYGNGRLPTMRYIETAALDWERRGIWSIDAAEIYLMRLDEMRSVTGRIKASLGIRDRNLTPTEQKYVDAWANMGFEIEVIEKALDRTVIKTGKRTWGYMNSILKSWHEKGLHTVAAIEAEEGKPAAKAEEKPAGNGGPTVADLENMRRLLREFED